MAYIYFDGAERRNHPALDRLRQLVAFSVGLTNERVYCGHLMFDESSGHQGIVLTPKDAAAMDGTDHLQFARDLVWLSDICERVQNDEAPHIEFSDLIHGNLVARDVKFEHQEDLTVVAAQYAKVYISARVTILENMQTVIKAIETKKYKIDEFHVVPTSLLQPLRSSLIGRFKVWYRTVPMTARKNALNRYRGSSPDNGPFILPPLG